MLQQGRERFRRENSSNMLSNKGSSSSFETRIIIGAQWGDEGKGKIVDLLAEDADLVCRGQVRLCRYDLGHLVLSEIRTSLCSSPTFLEICASFCICNSAQFCCCEVSAINI